jgi:hypothetical protein
LYQSPMKVFQGQVRYSDFIPSWSVKYTPPAI